MGADSSNNIPYNDSSREILSASHSIPENNNSYPSPLPMTVERDDGLMRELSDGFVSLTIHAWRNNEKNYTGCNLIGEDTWLDNFHLWYRSIHGYLAIAICVLGIASNVTNVSVLLRRAMISPTNQILSALAMADVLTMLTCLPSIVYFYCVTHLDHTKGHPYGWLVYRFFSVQFGLTTHTTSTFLTVALAAFRYIVVCREPYVGLRLCSLKRARLTILAVSLVTPVICIPSYVQHRIVQKEDSELWWHEDRPFVTPAFAGFNFWLFGVVFKIAPCIALMVLSALLIRAMRRADQSRRRLKSRDTSHVTDTTGTGSSSATAISASTSVLTGGGGTRPGGPAGSAPEQHTRTTAMLVAVVFCFVVVELPMGVLALVGGICMDVFEKIYEPFGALWEILGLISCCVNFILYCSMSRQFREIFCDVIKPLRFCGDGARCYDVKRRCDVMNCCYGEEVASHGLHKAAKADVKTSTMTTSDPQ